MYRMLRAILFCLDPEWVHYFAMNCFRFICTPSWMRKTIRSYFSPNATNAIPCMGLTFRNVVGLAAGFEKNALYLRELETLGFGSVEIGTVTPLPQEGNDQPRLFRLPKDEALINRMGFNNHGVQTIKKRLIAWRQSRTEVGEAPFIIGGNIGKNKVTPNELAWKDYEICFNELYDVVDYFVVNVSSPNTPGLRALQEKGSLQKILTHLQLLRSQHSTRKPILLKIAPDLNEHEISDVTSLAIEIELDGLVVANTTIQRDQLKTKQKKLTQIGAGGLSGKPLQQRATEMVNLIHHQTKGTIPIIASGGIFTAADAKEKLAAGASLIQVWTGFVYEGPAIVKKIIKGLS
ncbi:MAG: quinone-dependent dihydroorotate dehydrogenase [Chitinophagaceae bacterium]